MKELEKTIKYLMRLWAEKNLKEQTKIEKVLYSGPIIGPDEYEHMMDAIFNNWWSGGKFTIETENKIATISQRNNCLLFNSGSSANLALMSAAKEIYFKDNDKILTLACAFPTTVNPIIQNNLTPVFTDISLDNFGLDPQVFEDCLKSHDIRGVFIPHHLGFPNDIDAILNIARKHDIIVFFDCCDAYGTTYNGKPIQQYGKASTLSFYVAHHITMAEGGGIVTNDSKLNTIMRGMRNWGRHCASENCCVRSVNPEVFCPGVKLTTNDDLPEDYIVNYQYEWMGYNLKPLELQSAILCKQLDKLDYFNKRRIENYNKLYNFINTLNLPYKIKTWPLEPGISPFAFPMILPEDAPFKRKHLINFLKHNNIECRLLFSGNITRHPAYKNKSSKWEVYGTLTNSDIITERFIMLGVAPIITEEKINKVQDKLNEFFKSW